MLDDFLDTIEGAKTREQVWQTCAAYFAANGLDKTIYVDSHAGGSRIFTTMPDAWLAHYQDQSYIRFDPFLEHCCHTLQPVGTGREYLSDHSFLGEAARRLIMEAGEVGFRAGFSCTTRKFGPNGAAGWNLGSELGRCELERIRDERGDMLRLAALYGHERIAAVGSDRQADLNLSLREKDCLRWSAGGLRTKEIAERMNLRPVTVELHLKNARTKLRAATREQAVAIALLKGVIEL
ncbi:MAG: autoinducer binding domain-containing protein [Hoeflea sp.]|uniref:helix-turn-helix transcriptional regulator n=1 Tax=Hoeflea sp. TaxID=1940281 RepID=UPI0032EFF97C